MDEADPEITFNSLGDCNHCLKARKNLYMITNPNIFEQWATKIVLERKPNQSYDGILGLSGGLDSSYLLVKLVESGVKPLVFHVDAGWNSAESVKNIYNLVTRLNIDLQVEVIDWDFVRNLQIAFLNSGLRNQDIPQDYLFLTHLFKSAEKNKIKNIFTGSNYATENILPSTWGESALDYKRIMGIMKDYGLKPHPQLLPFNNLLFYVKKNIFRLITVHEPLNLMSYSKEPARVYLQKNYDWQNYEGKHTESQFTRYFQEVYLVNRFGINKKKAHLSSLIVNNEIDRATALDILDRDLSNSDKNYFIQKYIANKLGIHIDTLRHFEALAQNYSDIKFKSSKIQYYFLRILEKITVMIKAKLI